MAEYSCYSMGLYCDNESAQSRARYGDEFPHTFTGKNYTETKRRAKNKGWAFRGEKVFCPFVPN